MKSKDIAALEKAELQTKLAKAIKDGDEQAMAMAFAEFAQVVQEEIINDANTIAQEQMQDSNILSSRGVRQLTSEEKKAYGKMISAMQDPSPKQALTNYAVTMPETVIDAVMDDIVKAHPLLEAINFVNTMGVVKMVVNKQGIQTAVWGTITAAITAEISGAFGEIDISLNKLSAFMPVSKALLDLGPAWLDRYVRATLSEANAYAFEIAVVDGDGNGKPIGMSRDVSEGVAVVGGVYPRKTPIIVTSFAPIEYGNLLADLAIAPNDGYRPVNEVILIVNPVDYLRKVMPATTYLTPQGTYVSNVFPVPTKVHQVSGLSVGSAIIGLGKRYFLGVGSPKQGQIEYDDSVQFLEDNRVYITKLYANGRALDEYAFLLLDISNLAPVNMKVEVVNEVEMIDETPEIGSLTVTSVAGTETGDTAITIDKTLDEGNKYKYKIGASLTAPKYNQLCTTGYSSWNGIDNITAATGQKIMIVEMSSDNMAKYYGQATVVAKA